MAFPQTPLVVAVALFLGGTWVDITSDVYLRNPIQITWGRQDWASQPDTTKCPLSINNRLGKYSPKNPSSPYFNLLGRNTPVRIDVVTPSGLETGRLEGRVSSWPSRWDVSGKDVYVAVQANGIQRRLKQGLPPARDPLRRHIQANGPLAYWPLTDGENARQGTELMAGGSPLRSVGSAGSFFQGQPNWGKGTLASWLDSVVELPDETNGYVTATVRPQQVTAWSVDHVVNSRGPGNVTQLTVFDNGPQNSTTPRVEWDVIEWGSGGFNQVQLRIVERLEDSSSTALLATINTPGIYDGGVHHLRLSVADNGTGGLNWTLYIDGVSVATGSRATGFRPVGQVKFDWSLVEGGGVATEGVPFGHLTYWGAGAPRAADTWRAVQGYVRELAGRRIERLCGEQSVPLLVVGNLDQTPQMGPQRPGVFLDLLQSAAEVDGGGLFESRDVAGLAYRTRRSKYNQGG